MTDATQDPATHSRWLSQDFVEWSDTQPQDVVIVGSGYGAAMAAHSWAGCTDGDGKKLRMVLLERGRERLAGSFASTLDELPGDVRLSRVGQSPIGRRDALLDVRLAGDVSALVANGLGGGSLINAGVMVEPAFGSFDSRLPPGVEADLQARWFGQACALLGASVARQANTIERHPDVQTNGALLKTDALKQFQHPNVLFSHAPITVRMASRDNAGQAVKLAACTLCGDCLTGCNVGAKVSLDTNLLVQAQRAGLRIFTSASVLRLRRENALWSIEVVHTNPQVQARLAAPLRILAHKVVLAAGSLGSTEILLRSQHKRLAFSPRLGEQFSLNGDNTATIACQQSVNAVADEAQPLSNHGAGVSPRRVGPEITGMLSWLADRSGPGFLVQEFSVPAPLRGFFQEIVTTRGWLERMASADSKTHWRARPQEHDPLAIDRDALGRELLVGLIGHDSATGRIELPRERRGKANEGSVRISWPGVNQDAAMADAFAKLERRVQQVLGRGPRVTPNPLWRLLPAALWPLVGSAAGGALTVHPLGGCAMGESAASGVVNEWGAVFQTDRPSANDWQDSLLVFDGALVPASLGANPALTIAALSLRAADHWRTCWGWQPPRSPPATPPPVDRPRARALADCLPSQPPKPTQVQIIERLWGRVDWLNGPTGRELRVVELTFAFEPHAVDELTQRLHKRLQLMPAASHLRIYRWRDWVEHALDVASDKERDTHAEARAPIRGHMDLMTRMPGCAWWRTPRAFAAFLRNRGLRDLLRWWRSRAPRSNVDKGVWSQVIGQIRSAWRMASQAGEVRAFSYHAQVTGQLSVRRLPDQTEVYWQRGQAFWHQALSNAEIQGDKRFTYAWGENPWNQLLHLKLRFLGRGLLPRWWWPVGRPAFALKLDARFPAGQGVPLLRITEQANQVRALTDLAHLGLYWSRLFLKLNLWHLRTPDPPPEGAPQRLPGAIKGLPAPEITEIELEPMPSSGNIAHRRAVVRLTRYRGSPSTDGQGPKPPLVFIHGYSASGTTFAHNAIEHHAAGHFWRSGRDIWILDLRTSAGMPTARDPWTFEDVAWADIPVAIDHIAQQVCRERGGQPVQVDVFAHCIGAVMLSMALLTDPNHLTQPTGQPQRHRAALALLPGHLHKIVLSQKGFCVDYTDANILRSYLINQVKAALEGGRSFRSPPLPRQRDRLFDAFLNTLPYPPEEWPAEHPWWSRVPWSTTRRRLDALFERTFNIQNMPRAVLERIDDFFGPVNLQTLSQVIHFARYPWISDARGNRSVFPKTRLQHWPRAGTLLLSAKDSGMVNPHTSQRMQQAFDGLGIPNVQRSLVSGGHQDSLIGHWSRDLWCLVEDFL